jgi:hypothetical protein
MYGTSMQQGPSSRFIVDSCLAYSSTLMMEAPSSSETPIDFHRNTRRYIPEDITLYYNIKSKNNESSEHKIELTNKLSQQVPELHTN